MDIRIEASSNRADSKWPWLKAVAASLAMAIAMACREGRTTEVGPLVRPVNAMALDASRALAAWVGPGGGQGAQPR